MNCSKCGAVNDPNALVCANCGNPLNSNQIINNPVAQVVPVQPQPQVMVTQPVETPVQPTPVVIAPGNPTTGSNYNGEFDFIKYFSQVLIKPTKVYNEAKNNFNDIKTPAIMAVIISFVMMLLNLINVMIATVFMKTLNFSTMEKELDVDFGRLKDLDFLSLIGKNLLIYMSIIFVIAGVYYISALIIKKSASYPRFLAIISTTILPYIIASKIVAPLLGQVWIFLMIVSLLIGNIYTLFMLIGLVDEEVPLNNRDYKIYYHVMMLSIIATATYYLGMKYIAGLFF